MSTASPPIAATSPGAAGTGVTEPAHDTTSRSKSQPRFWRCCGLAGLAVVVGAALALVAMLPSDEELARRAEAALSQRLGITVSVGALDWQLFPSPAVTLQHVSTAQPRPIRIQQLRAYPALGALVMQRQLTFRQVEIDDAVIPRESLGSLQFKSTSDNALLASGDTPLQRLQFSRLSWVMPDRVNTVLSGDIEFDAHWRPRRAAIGLPEAADAAQLDLRRRGQQDVWNAAIAIGGGTLNGELRLASAGEPGTVSGIDGTFNPRGIEISSLLSALGRRAVVAGVFSGSTQLSASGSDAGELLRSLRTQTRFSFKQSTLLRFDLEKAMRTLGKDHAGTTRLDALTGQLVTQNTPGGVALTFTDMRAEAGAFKASGKGKLQGGQLAAELSVDVVDGVVGLPLKVSGPVNQLAVSMPAGAVAGAAAGTAVLPGLGTALGARLGAAVGAIFGSGDKPKRTPAPVRRSPD